MIHTGLTPVDETFQGIDFPPEKTSFSLDYSRLNHSSLEFFSRLPPDNGLTTQPETMTQALAQQNSALDMVNDCSLAFPSFLEELQTYGQIVGPGQRLCDIMENYTPSKPLGMLNAAADIPGGPYSVQDQSMRDIAPAFDGLDSFRSDFNFQTGCNREAELTQHLQTLSSIASVTSSNLIPSGSIFVSSAGYGNNLCNSSFDFGNSYGHHSSDLLTLGQSQVPHFKPSLSHQMHSLDANPSRSPDVSSPPVVVETKSVPLEKDKFYDEKPTRPSDKPWVRVNSTTQGKTSRTGKINHYDPDNFYSVIPHPLNGEWSTPQEGRRFRYNRWHELTKNCLSASQLTEFIYQHPKTNDCRLTLYIQRSPADSKRRYPTSSLDKCRFRECPMRVHGNKGSFLHGHYRVALDELSYKYGCGKGELNDPFQVAGYVHLYCLERFMDLPAICALENVSVEADGRQQMSKEPNGNFAAALGVSEYRVTQEFIDSAKKGRVQENSNWADYPEHIEYRDRDGRQVQEKQHRHTLNYALQLCKNAGRGGRVMSRLKPSNVAVHRGDLEMYCLGRKGLLSDERVAEIMAELDGDDRNDSSLSARGEKRRYASGVPSLPSSSPSVGKKVRYAPY